MCVTFSGESGVIAQYLDGVREKSETGIAQEFDGGGTLTIGEAFIAQPYQITGFNLWDRVLPAMDIKDLATSCLKGIGNVKDWLEFSDKAKSISSSKCPVCVSPRNNRVLRRNLHRLDKLTDLSTAANKNSMY